LSSKLGLGSNPGPSKVNKKIPIGFSCANIYVPKIGLDGSLMFVKGSFRYLAEGYTSLEWVPHSVPVPTSADLSLQNEASV